MAGSYVKEAAQDRGLIFGRLILECAEQQFERVVQANELPLSIVKGYAETLDLFPISSRAELDLIEVVVQAGCCEGVAARRSGYEVE